MASSCCRNTHIPAARRVHTAMSLMAGTPRENAEGPHLPRSRLRTHSAKNKPLFPLLDQYTLRTPEPFSVTTPGFERAITASVQTANLLVPYCWSSQKSVIPTSCRAQMNKHQFSYCCSTSIQPNPRRVAYRYVAQAWAW